MTVTPGKYEIFYGNSSDAKDFQMARVTTQQTNRAIAEPVNKPAK